MDMLPTDEAGEVLGLLVGIGIADDLIDTQVAVSAIAQCYRR
jgi:hypothetical protein